MNPEITLLHVHASGVSEAGVIGYARLGVNLVNALTEHGVDVYDHLDSPDDYRAIKQGNIIVESGRRAKPTNTVCWVAVPGHARGWWQGQHTVLFTMWEATQLPESFREKMHELDTLIVPSLHNVELFGTYHDDVHYVPLGVDPQKWHYTPRPEDGTFFNFMIGGSGKRKGVYLAFDAFQKVFGDFHGDGPIPRLIFKSPKGGDFYGENIEVVAGHLSDQDEIDLYGQAHCYLQPSYGEGFGLQPLQAMAQGIPTILTDAHGHTAFSHLAIPLGWHWEKADYFIYGDAGQWWAPDFDQLCEQMRVVYDDYDAALAHAKTGAEVIAREFTWANTASGFCDVLGDDLTKPFTPSVWFTPQQRYFLTVTNRPWTCDVAGTKYHFEPGEPCYMAADVKRILFEAGLLDPSCLMAEGVDIGSPDDLGITEDQLRRLPEYMAKHSHCPTCGQRMNTSPTRADELYQEMAG